MSKLFFFSGLMIDGLAVLIALGFVVVDVLKGRSGTNNPTMFLAIMAMAAIIFGAVYLKSIGKMSVANVLLWIPGFPLLAYGFFVLLFIILKPDMR